MEKLTFETKSVIKKEEGNFANFWYLYQAMPWSIT